MQHSYHKRWISFLSSAALVCNLPAGNVLAAEFAPLPAVQQPAVSADSELTEVIITLDGSTALDSAGNPEALGSQAAQSASERAERQQARIIEKLRKKYPALETGEQFTTLVNGFTCELPKSLIAYAESLEGVTGVSRSEKITIEPDLANAAELGNIPAYYDETGCTGEGQVIAIIDTELNLDHPMFAPLPDDVNVKLTKADIDEIANTVGFNCHDNWRNGYYNSKVPYAVDYSEFDPMDVSNDNENVYHGSHVAGIAAGNAIETDDGKTISGIAPNAQIIFMAVDDNFTIDRIIEAIEDAVKLKADVINMSFGIDYEVFDAYQPLTDAINAAEAAGITVCISAGNSDNGSDYYGTQSADDPDRSIINGLITDEEKALAVASADNIYTLEMHTLSHNGTLMTYNGCAPSAAADVQYLGDVLGTAEYAYEYCGLGYPEDFADKDLTGKLALVDRGELDFTVKADNAKAAGAVGVIVVQNQPADYMTMLNTSDILLALISMEDGQTLKDAEVKTVSFTEEIIEHSLPTKVSDYTSWGVHNSLELRPDIMGIGANVESASNTGSGTSVMSGTSMASPYLAGCAALLDEYLDKTGCTLTGSERQQRIRNLMMTSAFPYSEDDLFVTPRRQGAGLVSINRAVHDKVLLTGAEGESKLNLRDGLGAQFSFPVTVTNISDEDVVFSSARIELTTDETEYDAEQAAYLLTDGQQTLSCTADFGDLAAIAAGDSKTVNVTVTLDAAQAASLDTIFTNGYFIEGYLLLEGAENCCDISVPLLGFSKCFSDMPLFGDLCASVINVEQSVAKIASESYFDLIKTAQTLEYPKAPVRPENPTLEESANYTKQLIQYNHDVAVVQKPLKQISTIYLSPNHDYRADEPGFLLDLKHECLVTASELLDQDGNIAAKGFEAYPEMRLYGPEYESAYFPNELLYGLPEGAYTLRVSAGMTKEVLRDHPQTLETKVIIDTTEPELQTEVTEKNGRKILKLTAKDDRLDSVTVLGKGSGSLVDPERYDRIAGTGKMPVKDFLALSTVGCGGSFMNLFYAYDSHDENYYYYRSDPEFDETIKKSAPLLRMLDSYDGVSSGDPEATEWFDLYDFGDVIKAEPDKNGTFTMEYDITDFSIYNITVFDKAFNAAYVDHVDENFLPKAVPSGIYRSLHGLYEFTEDTVRFYPFAYGLKPTTYHYCFERQSLNGVLFVLEGDFDDSMTKYGSYRWKFPSETELILHGTDEGNGFRKEFGIQNTVYEHLELTDLTSAADYFAVDAFTVESYIIPFVKEYAQRGAVNIYHYALAPEAVVTYSCLANDIGGGHAMDLDITVDLKTGIATLPDGSTVNLLNTPLIKPGDCNEDSTVDVADAVMLARLLTEDADVIVSEQGKKNADCNRNGQPDQQDVVMILQAIARLIKL